MAAIDYHLIGTLGSELPLSNNDASYFHNVENFIQEVRLASAVLKRYKIAQMGHWQWQYKSLYGKRRDVYDGGLGRNDLFALLQADNEMSYLVPQDQGGYLSYTVRFAKDSYRNQPLFRSGDLWAWSVAFELIQVK